MRAWLREDILRRVLRNTGLLGAGKAGGAVLHLIGLGLTARLLGPAAFGLLILVRSYAQAGSGIARFQSWQALIRFGAVRSETDRTGFRDLIAFTVTVDAAAGTAVGILAALVAPLLAPRLGIGADAIPLVQVYCAVIPVMASATPTGILRIFDRFDLLSWQNLATPAARLAGIGAGASLGSPPWALVAAWLISDLAGDLFLWIHAWRELRRRDLLNGPRPSLRRAMRENDGLVRFSLAANAASTLNQAVTPLLTLLVGALLGAAAAGAFRIAQVIVEAGSIPGELAMRSLFPELARLIERDRDHFSRLIRRILSLSAGFGALLTLLIGIAGPLVTIEALGGDYAGAAPVLRIVALCFVPLLAAYPLETALLTMGYAGRVLAIRALAALVVFAGAAPLVRFMGLEGAAVALTAGAAVLAGGLLATLRRSASHGRR